VYVLAHGCSQHIASPSEVPSASSLVVERVVVRTTPVEWTTAVLSWNVGAVEVLSWSFVAWKPLPASDLASRVLGWVVKGIVVVDRSSHVERVVPPALTRRSTLSEVLAV
jgi:hypothetical protein